MRPLLFVFGIIFVAFGSATHAQAQNYPWCAHLDFGDGAVNCGFVNFDQCQATTRGIGGFCMLNNTYQPPLETRKRHSK